MQAAPWQNGPWEVGSVNVPVEKSWRKWYLTWVDAEGGGWLRASAWVGVGAPRAAGALGGAGVARILWRIRLTSVDGR